MSTRKEFINPAHVFFAIVIVTIIWFAPIAKTPRQAARIEKPTLIEYIVHPRLVLAVPEVEAGCPAQCQIEVCVDWDPNPCGTNPWDIGCCLAYATECDPGCDVEPPPPDNQPPAISHILNCTQNESNGWCIGNLSLDLTASDPQGSQVIISGDVNGTSFVCPAGNTTCSVPLPEGAGNTNYKVDASTTGLFATGTTDYLLDSSTPQLNGLVSGVVGTNNWYKSDVTLSVVSSDLISGIASATVSVDGGAQTTYSTPIELTDGIHTVTLLATDNAGHVTQTTQSFNIDTVTPVLNISLSGTMGLNNWYISNVTITPSVNDSGSGLAKLEVSQDGSAFTDYQSPITFSDGMHSYQFRATDNAGNITESGQTLNVDTTTPTLELTTTGTMGLNGWYRSSAQIAALGTDSVSGVAKIEVSTDGGAYLPYTTPVTVNDGQHNYQFQVIDNAGNVTQTAKAVKVDTVTPNLSLKLNGTHGQNDWYVSSTSVIPTAADATSGIATLEVSQDGSVYTAYQSTLFSDGIHTYRLKATDNAGNITETPAQSLKVDTIAPVIEMDDELKLGEHLYYDLEDPIVAGQENSGLFIYRVVIEDDDEKYKKLVWLEELASDKAQNSILWDGKFSDGTQAGLGEYFITLKISDAAGNERMRTAVVKVGLLSFLEEIPAFTPPASASAPLPAQTAQTDSAAVTEFGGTNSRATGETTSESASAGGTNNEVTADESAFISTGGTAVFNSETEYVKSGFTQGNETASTPITNSNILWGAVATAALGATLADWQRKREEEEARKRAEAAAQEEGGRSGKKTPGQIAYEKVMKQKHIVGESQALLNKKGSVYTPSQKLEEAETNWLKKMNPVYQYEKRKEELQKKAELQAGLSAYYEGRKKGEEKEIEKEKPSQWEKAINWVDKNQTETSMGVGAIVGMAAIAVTLVIAGAVTLPVLLVAAGIAAVTAGAIVAAGTFALNAHYDRPSTTNIFENVRAAAVTAAVVSGVGLFVAGGLLTQATIVAGNAIAGTCASNPALCTNAGTILNVVDTLEESSLALKLSIETALGNPQAGETAIELQLEQMDGGIPGNSVALELGGQIAKLGPDAAELIGKYGDDVTPLLLMYGADAVDIIGAYGDEGISLLRKFGDEAGQAIELVKKFGDPAVKLLDAVDLTSANTLLKTLDDDVLDYAIEQGPDALFALSRWSEKDLREFGPELALRAKKDAQVFEDISKLISLGPIDSKHLTNDQQDLINVIAENSMQYNDQGQIVLGKWVDYGNGFTSYARETGSVHYNPHPDMWELFGEFGNEVREDAAWQVNKQVIQTGIDKGLPFEYTLEGIPARDILKEKIAVQLIFSGATDLEVKQALRSDYLPIRMREIQELQKAGYEVVFDEISGSFILTSP